MKDDPKTTKDFRELEGLVYDQRDLGKPTILEQLQGFMAGNSSLWRSERLKSRPDLRPKPVMTNSEYWDRIDHPPPVRDLNGEVYNLRLADIIDYIQRNAPEPPIGHGKERKPNRVPMVIKEPY